MPDLRGGTGLVGNGDEPALLVLRERETQGKHVLADDVAFDRVQRKVTLGIGKGDLGMVDV